MKNEEKPLFPRGVYKNRKWPEGKRGFDKIFRYLCAFFRGELTQNVSDPQFRRAERIILQGILFAYVEYLAYFTRFLGKYRIIQNIFSCFHNLLSVLKMNGTARGAINGTNFRTK